MSWGIIGAGAIGQALAARFTAAGQEVVISNSRGPQSLAQLASELGSNLHPGTVAEAGAADTVVLAVPWSQVPAAVDAAGVADWRDRIVVDTTNPLEPPDFRVADLGGRTSSEVVQDLVAGARLVKAFNTLAPAALAAEPRTGAGRRVVFLSGDHPGANREVATLVHAAGWAPVDLGPLAVGGRLQQFPGGPLPTLDLLLQG
ncbi:NADP oxidoreductase coenzyme F420-dependent [Kineococcus radiotolerans SRS30216 = ATCC BAA-149]|uniref:NADP oxidoreductase coenzyme F420-dependent n=1 Tax=Kineococcus radiotolerans (strain ATCC BAA-149 / DSM 14245 / SRS30216) TaxID=266940 RepID=A6WAD1_KINRD|nr:NADP oxidoreductase coenzyme F420-dependent [Kineococcus radiotolerans SRS30216 = ATCC BAA-149]